MEITDIDVMWAMYDTWGLTGEHIPDDHTHYLFGWWDIHTSNLSIIRNSL